MNNKTIEQNSSNPGSEDSQQTSKAKSSLQRPRELVKITERNFYLIKRDGLLLIIFTLIFFSSAQLLGKHGGILADKFFSALQVDYRYLPTTENEEVLRFRSEENQRLQNYINNVRGTEFEKQRLLEQAREIQGRVKSHVLITRHFYVQYFVSVTITTVSAIIASICLFIISKSGWNHAKNSIIMLFTVSFAFTTIFSGYVLIFKYDENISENKKLYFAYSALDDRLSSYFATGTFLVRSEGENKGLTAPAEVIQYIDGELATINNIAIGFDATKIPNYQDYQNLDGTSSQTASP